MKDRPARVSIWEQSDYWLQRTIANDLSAEEKRELLTWLKLSPQHVAASLDTYRLYGELKSMRLFEAVQGHLLTWTTSREADNSLSLVFEPTEQDTLDEVETFLRLASVRDLVLWTEDSVPIAPRLSETLGLELSLPESTLKVMAAHERQRRQKRTEKIWWIATVVVTGLVSAAVAAVKAIGGS